MLPKVLTSLLIAALLCLAARGQSTLETVTAYLPGDIYYVTIPSGSSISYTIGTDIAELLTLTLYDNAGTVVTLTSTSSNTTGNLVANREVEYVHMRTTAQDPQHFWLELQVGGSSVLSITEKRILDSGSLVKYIPPATESYTFTHQTITIYILDDSGTALGTSGPVSLTASETYYLSFSGASNAASPTEVLITVTVCSAGESWNAGVNECQLTVCMVDPNSDGSDDGAGNCNCDSGYLWNNVADLCGFDCSGDANSDGDEGITADECECLADYLWNTNTLVCGLDCTSDANADGDAGPTASKCSCVSGYKWSSSNQLCEEINCDQIDYTDGEQNGQCGCVQNFEWNGQACVVKCSDIEYAEDRDGVDVCLCEEGYEWNSDDYLCQFERARVIGLAVGLSVGVIGLTAGGIAIAKATGAIGGAAGGAAGGATGGAGGTSGAVAAESTGIQGAHDVSLGVTS